MRKAIVMLVVLAAFKVQAQENERHWYGWQILLSDAASFGAAYLVYDLGGGKSSDADHAQPVAVVGYLLGGPTIHALHGNPGDALASLGLRIGLPVGGALLGIAASNCGGSQSGWGAFCGIEGAAIGGISGFVAAEAIDIAALAWSSRGTTAVETGDHSSVSFGFDPRRRTLGFAGTF